jgi:hypothetical protein
VQRDNVAAEHDKPACAAQQQNAPEDSSHTDESQAASAGMCCTDQHDSHERAPARQAPSKREGKAIQNALWCLENAFRCGYVPGEREAVVELIRMCPESESKKECLRALNKARLRAEKAKALAARQTDALQSRTDDSPDAQAHETAAPAREAKVHGLELKQQEFGDVTTADIDAHIRALSHTSHTPCSQCTCGAASDSCLAQRLRAARTLAALAATQRTRAMIWRDECALRVFLRGLVEESDVTLRQECGSLLHRVVEGDAVVAKLVGLGGVQQILEVCARESGQLNALGVQVSVRFVWPGQMFLLERCVGMCCAAYMCDAME